MSHGSIWFVFLLASGCSGAALIENSAGVLTPRAGAARCRLLAEREGECRGSSGSVLRLALPFQGRAAVPRQGGGAYVLGGQGELARFDAQGRLTGVATTDLSTLSQTPGYVCGVDGAGQVQCARDHHHDRACPGVEMPAFFPVPLVAASELRARGKEVCANDASGAERCVRVRAQCASLCVAFPACSPLRCVDPCDFGA